VDMGVAFFDTPYNALKIGCTHDHKNKCRKPTGFGFPENTVTYTFPGTEYTADTLKWIW